MRVRSSPHCVLHLRHHICYGRIIPAALASYDYSAAVGDVRGQQGSDWALGPHARRSWVPAPHHTSPITILVTVDMKAYLKGPKVRGAEEESRAVARCLEAGATSERAKEGGSGFLCRLRDIWRFLPRSTVCVSMHVSPAFPRPS